MSTKNGQKEKPIKAELKLCNERIAECKQKIEKHQAADIEMAESYVRVYKKFLHYWEDRKAQVASKIGRK